jgi:peptidoglycan/xylan/chitin deacetylase (PgdA/CDA1 family)
MRVPGLKRAKLFYRWVHGRFVGQALILGYHRVTEYEHDPYAICVTPHHFAEQLAVLCRLAQPITLARLIEGLHANNLPPRAVVVTLDDGYADTLYQAKPLLESYGVPATVFVTTGYQACQFWWEALARILSAPTTLPSHFDVPLLNSAALWEGKDTPTAREKLLWSLFDCLSSLPFSERQAALAQLQLWLGGAADVVGGENRPLTKTELRELANSELITIGGHTVTHPKLAALVPEQQEAEINQGKVDLEEILGRGSVKTFSYPNGSLDATTQALVRKIGFQGACASHHDVVHQNSDLFCLPRFWIPDWNGRQFSGWLQRWLPN